MANGGEKVHKGMDIRCDGDAVLATENGGKVVSVKGSGSGQSVTVEYSRKDGSKVQCTYMHLGEVSVKAGDTVKSGQQLGKTGGEHLHFGVKNIYADGTQRDIDPAAYLAEIAQKGSTGSRCCTTATTCSPDTGVRKAPGTENRSPPKDG